MQPLTWSFSAVLFGVVVVLKFKTPEMLRQEIKVLTEILRDTHAQLEHNRESLSLRRTVVQLDTAIEYRQILLNRMVKRACDKPPASS